jgi:hypothetical protein
MILDSFNLVPKDCITKTNHNCPEEGLIWIEDKCNWCDFTVPLLIYQCYLSDIQRLNNG